MELKSNKPGSSLQEARTAHVRSYSFASFPSRPVEILHVEDNPADVLLLQRALPSNDNRLHLTVVNDGESALSLLHSADTKTAQPLPDLILLDINLPKIDGWAVLSALKADPRLSHIPVIVLSSSESERDIRQAYTLGASCYVVKSVDYHHFQHTIQTMAEFWLACVRLPSL